MPIEMHTMRSLLPILLVLTGTVRGQTFVEVVGNLGSASTSNPMTALTYSKTFAQQFTTGLLNAGDFDGNGGVTHSFAMELNPALGGFDPSYGDEGGQPYLNTNFDWGLSSDLGGAPGQSLITSGYFTISSPGLAYFSYQAFSGDFIIQSNTSYWLTLRFAGSSDMVGQYPFLPVTTSTATSGAGDLGALKENTGGGWGGLSERAVLQIAIESVPEPGSTGLVALGLLSLWVFKRRRTCSIP